VNHGVTVESMMAIVLWEELRIWTISKVYAVYVFWYFSGNNIDHFVGVFMVNWSEVTFKEWIISWLNPKLTIEISFDGRKQQP